MNQRDRHRRLYAPAWWATDMAIQQGIVYGTAYGLQKISDMGLPSIQTTAGALSAGYNLVKRAGNLGFNTKGNIAFDAIKDVAIGSITGTLATQAAKINSSREKPKSYSESFIKDAHNSALFASHSYELPENRHSYHNWKHNKHLGNDRVSVHQKGDHWHISIRGTDISKLGRGISDIGHDMLILSGAVDFSKTKKKVQRIIERHKLRHGSGKLTISGHSLGGSMVAHMMEDPEISKYVTNAHAFSPGRGPGSNIYVPTTHPENLHAHINDSDMVPYMFPVDGGATIHHHKGGHWKSDWEKKEYWEEYTSSKDIEENGDE